VSWEELGRVLKWICRRMRRPFFEIVRWARSSSEFFSSPAACYFGVRRMTENIPWNKIKTEYLAGGISQQALADEYGISYKTLRDRAAKERWTELRAKTREKTGEKMTEAISDAKIKKIEQLVDRLLVQANIASRQLTKRPKRITEREKLADGRERVTVRTEYEEGRVVDPENLRTLSQTARYLYEIVQGLEGKNEDKNTITVRFRGGDDDADFERLAK